MELTEEHYRLGKIAYEAYCKRLLSGSLFSPFNELDQRAKDSWVSATIALSVELEMAANAKYRQLVDALCSESWEGRNRHDSVLALAKRMKDRELQIVPMETKRVIGDEEICPTCNR